ncbi:MAG TPA: porin [Archangium sp.]|uniref:porin n=1 Tax=Archangium sp. TaxID=1872627 RepID=UPI002E37298D|nr:porin [Archangium sp.]HEX5750567.1 porin [Archangium sp.]
MKLKNLAATLAAALLGVSGVAQGAEVLKTENATMNVGGRLQLLGFAQRLDDGARNDERLYLFLKQGRVMLSGNVEDWRYGVMLAFGGEDEIKAPTPGISLGLLDMYVDIPVKILGNSYVRVGQFRVPYGRERLTESGTLLFADRSIQNLAFRVGRDVGATFHTQAGPLVAGVGIFTGGGRGIPERYLPQTLGTPMVVLRAGVDTGIGEDVFATRNLQAMPDKLQMAFFVNGFYMKDSLVGHSTVLNTRPAEKSLLINGNWNPFLAQAPFTLGRLWQVGADAAARAPVGPGVLSGELEGNFGVYQNDYGDIRVAGGRAQVAYQWNPVQVALRYALVLPDERFAVGSAPITGKRALQEVTPAITYSFKGFGAKIIADLPIQLNTPVIFEESVGSYLLTDQPDQTSLLKKGAPISRQNVIAARLLVQATF